MKDTPLYAVLTANFYSIQFNNVRNWLLQTGRIKWHQNIYLKYEIFGIINN